MNQSQTIELLAFLTEAYPSFKSADPKARVAVWSDLLSDADFDLVTAAARQIARTEKFPPSAADILRAAADQIDGPVPSWAECKAMIEASSHGRGLPPGCHPIVRSMSAVLGGPTTLASLYPPEAERAARSAHATALACYQESPAAGLRRAIGEAIIEGLPKGLESATTDMFPAP